MQKEMVVVGGGVVGFIFAKEELCHGKPKGSKMQQIINCELVGCMSIAMLKTFC